MIHLQKYDPKRWQFSGWIWYHHQRGVCSTFHAKLSRRHLQCKQQLNKLAITSSKFEMHVKSTNMTTATWQLSPELESWSGGRGTRSPIWPRASIATEAIVAVSQLITSTRHLTVAWSNDSEACKKMNSSSLKIKFRSRMKGITYQRLYLVQALRNYTKDRNNLTSTKNSVLIEAMQNHISMFTTRPEHYLMLSLTSFTRQWFNWKR